MSRLLSCCSKKWCYLTAICNYSSGKCFKLHGRILSPTATYATKTYPDSSMTFNKPKGSKLIYKGTNTWFLIGAQSTLSIALLINCIDFSYLATTNWAVIMDNLFDTDMFLNSDDRLWYCIARMAFLVPSYVASYLLTKRTFNRMYFCEKSETFAGERFTWYLRKQYVLFDKGEATELPIQPTPLLFLKGSLLIHGQQFIAYPQNFKSIMHYNLMIRKSSGMAHEPDK